MIIFQISAYIPTSCITHLNWAYETGKHEGEKYTSEHYNDMIYVCGVSPSKATRDDFQRYFKCKNTRENECNKNGLEFPQNCSVPPCNRCNQGIATDKE